MRSMGLGAVLAVVLACTVAAQAPQTAAPQTTAATASAPPTTRPVGTMSDIMVKFIYPASDAVFYIETRQPETNEQWTMLQGQLLMLAESGNLLMLPGRARDNDQWMADARLLVDAGRAAYAAAMKKDVAGLVDVNKVLYESCTTCHRHYRPNYGRGATPR